MSKAPLGILTPFQVKTLRLLAEEPLLRDFYLTGGSALSAFYLQHRLSDDLDFFTESPQGVGRMSPVIRRIAHRLKARVRLGRRFETLFECSLVRQSGERLEMDFALDMPGRLRPVRKNLLFKIALDNPLDISCNKLSALCERSESKDFVDIFFIHQRYMPLGKLIRRARRKYSDLDDYGLAMAFFKVKDIALWPRMIKTMDFEELRKFFLDQARRLTKGFEGA